MSYDALLAQRVRQQLKRRPGFEEKTMFGGLGYLLHGNMCVGIWREWLIVRVDRQSHAALLELPHVRPFDITGKPMAGWLLVEPPALRTDADLCLWLERSLALVATLEPRTTPSSKKKMRPSGQTGAKKSKPARPPKKKGSAPRAPKKRAK